ncbi:hypothetical protein F4821DRAFT_257315 [Hypoxylon rubiginosum]|uniref:Uncharacterized protein n=1 Tax=Hypoxylon rubiginosum TaxID=110542 RepID=A0ACC0D9G9_9PEZI|nr:hypothetical protein F4821DRAFT_257315 [Hypoxylon rubiginosum]
MSNAARIPMLSYFPRTGLQPLLAKICELAPELQTVAKKQPSKVGKDGRQVKGSSPSRATDTEHAEFFGNSKKSQPKTIGVRDYCRGRCPSIATPLLDTAAAEVVQEHDDFANIAKTGRRSTLRPRPDPTEALPVANSAKKRQRGPLRNPRLKRAREEDEDEDRGEDGNEDVDVNMNDSENGDEDGDEEEEYEEDEGNELRNYSLILRYKQVSCFIS